MFVSNELKSWQQVASDGIDIPTSNERKILLVVALKGIVKFRKLLPLPCCEYIEWQMTKALNNEWQIAATGARLLFVL